METSKRKVINSFRDEYFFLSNFYRCPVMYMGHEFTCAEAAFQAAKCPARAREFQALGPSEAKKLGRNVLLREGWEYIKNMIMRRVVYSKFSQNRFLLDKLLSTGDAVLIEGNDWGDTYWGQVDSEGENNLGKILMETRAEMKLWHPELVPEEK